MNRSYLLIAVCVVFGVSCATIEPQGESQEYRISAVWIQAGGYQPVWEMTLEEWGAFELEGGYGGIHEDSFRFSGTGFLKQESRDRLDASLRACPLQLLPETIEPDIQSFHRPEIRLTLCTSSGCITRGIYDPGNVQDSDSKRCYLQIWDSIWSHLPFAPEWVRLPDK